MPPSGASGATAHGEGLKHLLHDGSHLMVTRDGAQSVTTTGRLHSLSFSPKGG